jgi:hypothetical protein
MASRYPLQPTHRVPPRRESVPTVHSPNDPVKRDTKQRQDTMGASTLCPYHSWPRVFPPPPLPAPPTRLEMNHMIEEAVNSRAVDLVSAHANVW